MFARMLLLLSLCLGMGVPVAAQQHRTTVRGTVLGPDLAPVSNVPMRAVHEETGETRRFISNAQGTFSILQMEPGSYRITSEDDRFSAFMARVYVSTNDDIVLTLSMPAVSISSDVDYRPFVLEVDRTSPAIRTRLPGDFLTHLPLDGRSLFDAIVLTPRLAARPTGPYAEGVFPATYTQDGFPSIGAPAGVPAVRPQLESVEHLDVGVPFFDASFSGGGPQVNIVTRSGTNRITGGAFGFAQTAVDRRQFGAFTGAPVARNRTFVFGDVAHTRFSGDGPMRDEGTDGGIRLDHHLADDARLTARYSRSDGIYFEQQGQLFGASVRHAVASGSNDVRLTISNSDEIGEIGLPGVTRLHVADTFAYALGDHVFDAGAEWQRVNIDTSGGRDGDVWSAFLQDHWWASPTLSVRAGLRVDRVDPPLDLAESKTHLLPRVGIAWQPFENGETVFRGAYGRFAETRLAVTDAAIHQWSVGAARQWSRTRTIEVAYEGARLPDVHRSHALIVEIEQRSEVGLTGHVGYSLGNTEFVRPDPADAADRRHHKLTGAFTWVLPFGSERFLFSDGLLEDIFGEMQLTGLFALENLQTDTQTGSRGDFKSLDVGLIKNVRLVGSTLQLRFETFNALNRPNRRTFFFPELLSLPIDGSEGRRYQVGARFVF